MKNIILLVGILFVILLCSYFLLKNKEGYTSDNLLGFVGINKGKLVKCVPDCKSGSKLNTFNIPGNELPLQTVYDKGVLAVLTTNNDIYVCDNCPLHHTSIPLKKWKKVSLPRTLNNKPVGIIKKISIDKKHIFALDRNGNVLVCRDCNKSNPSFETLNLPVNTSFSDFAVRDNSMIGFDKITNSLYGVHQYDITNLNWETLKPLKTNKKNANDEFNVSLGSQGYFIKDFDNTSKLCEYPCDNILGTWTNINNNKVNAVGYSDNYLSVIDDKNRLLSCKYPCSNSSNWKPFANTVNQEIKQAEVFSYHYPPITPQPLIPELRQMPPLLASDKFSNNNKLVDFNKADSTVDLLLQQSHENYKLIKDIKNNTSNTSNSLIKQLKNNNTETEPFEDIPEITPIPTPIPTSIPTPSIPTPSIPTFTSSTGNSNLEPAPPALIQTLNELNNNTIKMENIKTSTRQIKDNVETLKKNTIEYSKYLETLKTKTQEEQKKLIEQLNLAKKINTDFLNKMANIPYNAVITLDENSSALLQNR
jgi:hypothetical protein